MNDHESPWGDSARRSQLACDEYLDDKPRPLKAATSCPSTPAAPLRQTRDMVAKFKKAGEWQIAIRNKKLKAEDTSGFIAN